MLLICGSFFSFFRFGFSGFSVLCLFCFFGFVSLFFVGGEFLCLVPLVLVVLLFVLVVVVFVSSGVVFVGLLPCGLRFVVGLFLIVVSLLFGLLGVFGFCCLSVLFCCVFVWFLSFVSFLYYCHL